MERSRAPKLTGADYTPDAAAPYTIFLATIRLHNRRPRPALNSSHKSPLHLSQSHKLPFRQRPQSRLNKQFSRLHTRFSQLNAHIPQLNTNMTRLNAHITLLNTHMTLPNTNMWWN